LFQEIATLDKANDPTAALPNARGRLGYLVQWPQWPDEPKRERLPDDDSLSIGSDPIGVSAAKGGLLQRWLEACTPRPASGQAVFQTNTGVVLP